MRYSPEQSEATRKRILQAAGELFRQHGFGGVGVDAIAKAAGVTSGAFYSQFKSKADAFLAVAEEGLDRLHKGVEVFQGKYEADWFQAFIAYYLGAEHREDVGGGCALPSLSGEVARSEAETRKAYEERLTRVAQLLAGGLADAPSREAAWPILAQLAGGVMLARAVQDEDLAREIAEAVRKSLR
ncbi:MAG: TetR/AcrR family transcriptional regulator [Candidatus Protistobacter heckmanni]|nr:TetR/AcrR family transcriptional regulator [Candidatus Protistobacter heckmanni]